MNLIFAIGIGLLLVIGLGIVLHGIRRAPVGCQDEDGFHYGKPTDR